MFADIFFDVYAGDLWNSSRILFSWAHCGNDHSCAEANVSHAWAWHGIEPFDQLSLKSDFMGK